MDVLIDDETVTNLCNNVPEFQSNFEIVKKLGQGSFSTVVLARLKLHPFQEYAVKCLIPTTHPRRALTELEILRQLGGRENVINLLCTCRKDDRIFFLLDYFPHDHFPTFVLDATLDEIRDYIKNLLIALRHIHKFSIIHRDVKATNFLFNRSLRKYRLIDFGLAEFQHKVESCSSSNGKLKRKLSNHENEERSVSPPKKKQFLKLSPKLLGSVTNLSLMNQKVTDFSPTTGLAKRILFKEKTETIIKCDEAKQQKIVCSCYGRPSLCKTCKGKRPQKVNKAGTAGFRSPEVLLNHPSQTVAVDIWSAGMIFLGLLSRRYPFMRPRDDSTALAQHITVFGTEKLIRLSSKFGKKLLCRPLRQPLNLRMMCEVLRFNKGQFRKVSLSNPCRICSRSFVVFGCYICLCKFPDIFFDGVDILPVSAFNLLENILEVDPQSRWTAEDALNHEFFRCDDAIC